MNTLSNRSVGEPPTRPQMPVRDSLDDLFSDAEIDQDELENSNLDNEDEDDDVDTKEPTWASSGELFSIEPEARPYDPKAPRQFYQDMNVQESESTQISPWDPSHPHHSQSSANPPPDTQDLETKSALSEEEQVNQFGDKAFRKALREVEPSLSKEQQHYAWKKAYENGHGEQTDSIAAQAGLEGNVATTDAPGHYPPYKLGMGSSGYNLDEPPAPPNTNAHRAMDKGITNREHDSAAELTEEEVYEQRLFDASNSNDDLEAVRPFNQFSHYHPMPVPTDAREDIAQREKMLQSSFSEAVQALEKDNAERIARESEVDEAHLRRLRALSNRRQWKVDDLGDKDGDERPQANSPEPAYGREDSPELVARWARETEGQVHSPPPKTHQDDSFATAFESPDRQRGQESPTMAAIKAEMDDYSRQQYAHLHETEESIEHLSPPSRIPGLEHLARPSPPSFDSETQELSTPPIPDSHRFHNDNAGIRKSIEPETPTHLLHRDCTPAFEDRSPTPSPRSPPATGHENVDSDIHMNNASSSPLPPLPPVLPTDRQDKRARDNTSTITLPPTSSPEPISDISSPSPYRHRDEQTPTPTPTTIVRKEKGEKLSDPHSPTITPAPAPGPAPTKPRPTNRSRRKSAVLGTEAKISKPKAKRKSMGTPKSRAVSRKVPKAGAAATAKEMKEGVQKGSKVKEAVARIEASVQKEEVGQVKVKGTPPTRRSKRLLEREGRGRTPEGEAGQEREQEGGAGLGIGGV